MPAQNVGVLQKGDVLELTRFTLKPAKDVSFTPMEGCARSCGEAATSLPLHKLAKYALERPRQEGEGWRGPSQRIHHGRTVVEATYPDLYAMLPDFGYQTPDLRGRAPISGSVIGLMSGSQYVAIIENQLPPHAHEDYSYTEPTVLLYASPDPGVPSDNLQT